SVGFILLWSWTLSGKHSGIVFTPENLATTKRNLIFPTIMFGVSILVLFASLRISPKTDEAIQSGTVSGSSPGLLNRFSPRNDMLRKFFPMHAVFPCLIIVIVLFDLLRFAQK